MSRRRGQGAPVILGAKLGSGGEGTIYEAPSRPDLVAKMWTTPDEAKARKLDALLRSKPSVPTETASKVRLAWPQQPMYDKRRKTIGFAMPRASRDQYREFVAYSIPSARGRLEKELGVSIGERHLLGIARNVAEAFEIVHANGCLIGDVNHTNFLVSPDTSVFLIDVDSMQVTDKDTGEVYRCEVGTPDFTPPRLMGKRLPEIDRVPDDDYFGLATLIFQLLMEGSHPYDPVDSASSSGSGNARLENIKRGYSPYTAMLNAHARAWLTASEIPDPALRQRMRRDILAIIEGDSDTDYTALIDRRATAWLELNPKLQELFRRAFPNDQATDSPNRPTPLEWIEALEEVIGEYPTPAFPAPATAPSPMPTAAPRSTPHQFGVPLSEPVELWSCDIGYDVWFSTAKGISSPTVIDGAVYVGSPDGSVHVLDAATGDVKWKPPTGGGHIETKPAVVGDTVFVGSTDGSLHALSATTGHHLRKLEFDGALRSSPAAANGIIYFGSSNRYVYALRASTNGIIWAFQTGGAVRSSPAVARGVVYVGSWDNHLYAINAASGDLKWKFKTSGKVESSPTVANGVVYVGSLDNHVYAIDAASGRGLWKYDTGGSVRAAPAVSDGVVYVGSLSRRVFAFDAANGDLLWKREIGGSARTDLAAEDGVVYVAVANHIYALDSANGKELWKREVGEEEYVYHYTPSFAFSSLTLVDGVLYFTASDGFVRALKVAELRGTIRQQRRLAAINPGELMWRYRPGEDWTASSVVVDLANSNDSFGGETGNSWITSPVVVDDGSAYVGTYGGYVYSLDANTSALSWRKKIGDSLVDSLMVANRVVYAVSSDYNSVSGNTYYIRALDADTGKLKWKHRISNTTSLLTVVGGVVYAKSYPSDVYALDATTGALKWKRRVGNSVGLSEPVVADGVMYFGSFDAHVYALDADTGARKWTHGTGGRMVTSIGIANGLLYANTFSKKGSQLFAIDTVTGKQKWNKHDVRAASDSTIVNGMLYVESISHVFALNATTGSVSWSYNASDIWMFTTSVVNRVVYIKSSGGLIRAIDAVTGKLKWEYETIAEVRSTSIVGNIVYILSGPSGGRETIQINGKTVFESSTRSGAYALSLATGDLIWKYETTDEGSVVEASPLVVNGMMYFGTHDGYMYAVKAEEHNQAATSSDSMTATTIKPTHLGKPGELLWRYATGDGTDSSPVMANDVVYFGSRDGYMYALDANSGATIWRYKTGNSIESSPAVVDGIVYVGSYDEHVYALDADTGEVKWENRVGSWWGFLSSSPAVVNGVVYIGSNDKHLYSIDASSGEVTWKRKTGGMVKSSPTVVNGVVYVGSDDKHVYALHADTGEVRWKRKTDGKVKSSPAVMNGVVYVGSDDKHVYALYANTGKVRWKRKTDGKVKSSPAVVSDIVYVGSDDGNVYAIDSTTGTIRWKYKTKAEWLESVRSSPTVEDGVVYIGSDDNYVYALDANTGKVRWKRKTAGMVKSSPAVVNGVVYVGSHDNHVYALAAGASSRDRGD